MEERIFSLEGFIARSAGETGAETADLAAGAQGLYLLAHSSRQEHIVYVLLIRATIPVTYRETRTIRGIACHAITRY